MRNSLMTCLAIALCACASPDALHSRLDDDTGLTVVTMHEPVVLARPTRMAVAARDYAHIGPVEVNRMGRREYYLWIGLSSTVDRERVAEPAPRAETLALLIDGQPSVLPLTDWNPELELPPYASSTPVYASLAARASLEQIQRIAAAGDVEVHIGTAQGRTRPTETVIPPPSAACRRGWGKRASSNR